MKKLMGLASSFLHCYFEDAGVGLINGVMILRKDFERDQVFNAEEFWRGCCRWTGDRA